MKKIITRFFILGALIALLPAGIAAQALDARQRTAETIVADGLLLLPAPTATVFNQVMGEIAATGSTGVEMIAGMLVPADKGKNATFEYALNGVASYVTAPGQEALRADVRKGFLTAIERCSDNANRAFLFSQLQLCSTAEDAADIARYLDDSYLADYALRALISTPGTEQMLLSLAAKEGLTPERKAALAYAFGAKHMTQTEPIMLAWLNGADAAMMTQIYQALAVCGSQASLKPLAAATAKAGYGRDNLGATDAYLRLLSTLAATGDAQAVKAAKGLLKCDTQNVRGAALEILVASLGAEKALPYVLSAIKAGPAEYRFAALLALGKGNDALFAKIAAGMSRYDAPAQAAVISWLGESGAASQSNLITAAVASSDDQIAKAAIEASGRIGGEQALVALVSALEGPHAEAATKALLAFNGKINGEVEKLFAKNNPKTIIPALKLAAARRMTSVADSIFALLDSSDKQVSAAAYEALPYIAGPQYMDRLAALLDAADAQHVAQMQTAMIRTSAQLPAGEQFSAIDRYMKASKTPARYYSVLAKTGAPEAIESLLEGFSTADREAAFAALLTIDSPAMIDILYRIAAENPDLMNRALMRYADLATAADVTPIRHYQLYRRALELNPSAAVCNKLLSSLANVYTVPALMLAADYLTNAQTAPAAALAVKTIVVRTTPMLGGEAVRAMLDKARAIYRTIPDADAGYAVDEITELLSKLPATGFVALPMTDLTEWTAVVDKKQPARQLARASKSAEEAMAANWTAKDGIFTFAGQAPSAIGTKKDYENFELWLEWRSAGESGMGVRSTPQIRLGGAAGTGLLTDQAGSTPTDNTPGEWNTMYIKVVNDRMTLIENGVTTDLNITLQNPMSPGEAILSSGSIELLGAAAGVEFRNIYINELPSTPVFTLSAEEAAQGYEVLFDGRSLHKWTGNTTDYVPQDGTIFVTANYGGSGNLYTLKQYGDFVLRFEFRFLTEGVNNGIGIRTPMNVDAAFHGMEIQILDHDAPIYKDISDYQQHGSVYGVIAAKRVKFPPLATTWNVEEIRAVGDQITVTVNGEVILDGNIREACQGHNVSETGSLPNPYMVDKRNHVGLFNKSGHIGMLGHGAGVQFRNLRVLDLSTPAKNK